MQEYNTIIGKLLSGINRKQFKRIVDKYSGDRYKENIPIIDSRTLFALTLLIAESKPEEMDVMKQIVVSVLNSLAF